MSASITHTEPVAAARNALTLGTSLALTSAVALVVRLAFPRFLGPEGFGDLRLAESYAEMLFVLLTFGVDMQLRREAALDPTRARQYLSGLAAVRLGLGVVGVAAVIGILHATGARTAVVQIFLLVAGAQILLVLNNSYAALEHAAGDVGWLARTNLAVKMLWAAAMLAALGARTTGLGIAAVGLGIEATRWVWLTMRSLRRHGLQMRPDVRLATGAILSSFPLFVNLVAHNFYARIGTGWLGAVSTGAEVGLYGAAANLASIALLGMPLVMWVLVPSAARAAAQSSEHMNGLVAGALRVSLLMAVPIAVVFHAYASPLLGWIFGPEYQAAAPVLRILAPTFGLAYVSTVCAVALLQQDRTWTVAAISLSGLALTAVLNVALIPWGARTLGPLGAAQGAAWATLVTEVGVTVALAAMSRRLWSEPTLLRTIAALAVGVAGVVAAGALVDAPGLGPALAAAAFAASLVVGRGVTRDDLSFVRTVLGGFRRGAPAAMPTPALETGAGRQATRD